MFKKFVIFLLLPLVFVLSACSSTTSKNTVTSVPTATNTPMQTPIDTTPKLLGEYTVDEFRYQYNYVASQLDYPLLPIDPLFTNSYDAWGNTIYVYGDGTLRLTINQDSNRKITSIALDCADSDNYSLATDNLYMATETMITAACMSEPDPALNIIAEISSVPKIGYRAFDNSYDKYKFSIDYSDTNVDYKGSTLIVFDCTISVID